MSLELAHVLIVTCFVLLGGAALVWVVLVVDALWAKWRDRRNPVQPHEFEQSDDVFTGWDDGEGRAA